MKTELKNQIKALKDTSSEWIKEIGRRDLWIRIYPNATTSDGVEYHGGQPTGHSRYIPAEIAIKGRKACIEYLKEQAEY